MSDDRNPIFIPEGKPETKRRCCPKCQNENFNGRRIQGVVTFTCTKCGNQWHGGLPQEPQDPRVPHPADPNPPTVAFVRDPKSPTGVAEVRRRVDLRQEFRKGAPIDEEE